MTKVKVLVPKRTEVRINGKPYLVEEGLQELDKDLAELLLHVGIASMPSTPSPSTDPQPKQDSLVGEKLVERKPSKRGKK